MQDRRVVAKIPEISLNEMAGLSVLVSIAILYFAELSYHQVMKTSLFAVVYLWLVVSAGAEIKPAKDRKSLLDSDPDVVYLSQTVKKTIELTVIKEAPVFSDKGGKSRIGTLKTGQTLPLEAMSDKAYKVRGQGTRNDIAGWVAPWAFSSKDPDFVENLKKLYTRQIDVQALIAAKKVAIGMTLDEVSLVKGKPTKTTVRRTNAGQSGSWEYVDFETVNHYTTRIDPRTGQAFRQFAYATQEERGKVVIEFTNDVVSAIEESEDHKGGNVRVIGPPVVFGW